jgi:outer membrane protein assembly factor BamE (lipoprotein component of BamABCDE complex)
MMLVVLTGCAQYDNKRGVLQEVRPADLAQFTAGQTTRQDVMARLGPPSQVIALGDETVLYYLFERSKGNGLILIVYNRFAVDTRYDRAIFFFDEHDRLTDFATRVGDGEAG